MHRKLIQLSPTTTVISLPKSWTETQKLKKGDSVTVDVQGNTLLVRSTKGTAQKKVTLQMSGSKNHDSKNLADWFAVSSAYIGGASTIELHFPDKESSSIVDKFTSNYPGLISEQLSPKHFLLKDMGADGVDLEKIVQKVFHLLTSMSEEVADPQIRKAKDKTVNSYVELGLRQLRVQSHDAIFWSGLLYGLEQLADILVQRKSKNDSTLVKDLQILYLAYSAEKLVDLLDKLDDSDAFHQQIRTCTQHILHVRQA
ncbi:MAG TPA: AbrB/MazE/SpoVT family DNA-binding domain-containing protein [Acidobacteriota bacterium]|nr:AbrB/MazE/SpoVT family DNA-binding domain-containing protein [Acidobacteriota bacterium]